MEKLLDTFNKRWKTIETETLSSIRRQLAAPVFDISMVNQDFHHACDEWFTGKMAPKIWFSSLEEENPEKAEIFKREVNNLNLVEGQFTKPSKIVSYITTLLSVPVCYFLLDWFTGMETLSKSLFTVGTAVLVWYVTVMIVNKKISSYEEIVVDFYRQQLGKFHAEVRKILSK